MKSKDYATDRFHLNNAGKSKLCNRIGNTLFHAEVKLALPRDQTDNSTYNNIADTTSPDLIDLSDFDEPGNVGNNTTIQNQVQSTQESTFSEGPNIPRLFPNSSPNRSLAQCNFNSNEHSNYSLLDSPIVSDHKGQLLSSSGPTSSSYYKIAYISQNSFSDNVIHSSPIPIIAPGHNRPHSNNTTPMHNKLGNFVDPGPTSKI